MAALGILGLATHCGTPPCVDGETCADGEAVDGGGTTGLDSGGAIDPDARAGDGGVRGDASRDGASSTDGASSGDGGPSDGRADAGDETGTEGGATDGAADGSSVSDSGASSDAGADASPTDAGSDGASADAGGGPGGCVSGATGNYAARFKWLGSGPSSRAYVSYELNNLPDASRWRAGAYSRAGVGYNPTFTDTFLGVGGLEMGGTVFIDVELSTAMLSTLRRVTLSIFGRSFNTTASGSFSWMTFDGAGAAPSGSVANSAPYRWYSADATAAFRAGNPGVLLRISPGGPSGTLIVSRVELCFDASQ